jgi:hypothetical protein
MSSVITLWQESLSLPGIPLLAAISFLFTLPTLAQPRPVFVPDKMDTVLYGAAYYSEYMTYERLDKDVQLMQQSEEK